MALQFLNNTREGNDKYSFPAFIANVKDSLYEFNDQTFDLEYLEKHVNGKKAIIMAEKVLEKISPQNRVCNVGGNLIINPDDYIFMGLLTSDENEDLYRFNLMTLDRNNLERWHDREKFILTAQEFMDLGKWEDLGDYEFLRNLIGQVKRVV